MATKTKKQKKATKPLLNPKQALFVQLYTGSLFGNATMSYVAAYGIDLEKCSRYTKKDEEGNLLEVSPYQKKLMTCMVCGSQLLRNPKVAKEVRHLIAKRFNELDVDNEHAKVIFQNDDLHAKLGGIREFNRVRGRVKERESELPVGAAPITKIEIVMPKV